MDVQITYMSLPFEVKTRILEIVFEDETFEHFDARDISRIKSLQRKKCPRLVPINTIRTPSPLFIRISAAFGRLFVSRAFLMEALVVYAQSVPLIVDQFWPDALCNPLDLVFSGVCQQALKHILKYSSRHILWSFEWTNWSVSFPIDAQRVVHTLRRIDVVDTHCLAWYRSNKDIRLAIDPHMIGWLGTGRTVPGALLTTPQLQEAQRKYEFSDLPPKLHKRIIDYACMTDHGSSEGGRFQYDDAVAVYRESMLPYGPADSGWTWGVFYHVKLYSFTEDSVVTSAEVPPHRVTRIIQVSAVVDVWNRAIESGSVRIGPELKCGCSLSKFLAGCNLEDGRDFSEAIHVHDDDNRTVN